MHWNLNLQYFKKYSEIDDEVHIQSSNWTLTLGYGLKQKTIGGKSQQEGRIKLVSKNQNILFKPLWICPCSYLSMSGAVPNCGCGCLCTLTSNVQLTSLACHGFSGYKGWAWRHQNLAQWYEPGHDWNMHIPAKIERTVYTPTAKAHVNSGRIIVKG